MRRRSIAGPLLLIVIGALFLVYNLRPDLAVSDLIAVYWPFLLIAWGLIRAVEVTAGWLRGVPQRNGLGAGEVVLVIFISLVGSGIYAIHRHGVHFGVHGLDVFGGPHDYPVSAQKDVPGLRRIVVEHPRGDLRITGADAQELRVAGRKTVRALRGPDADRLDRETPLEILIEGDTAVLRTNLERAGGDRRISADLDLWVPRGVRVEIRGRSGDYEVADIAGDVDVDADRADVRLSRLGGSARLGLRRSELVRAVDLKGSFALDGRGSDVELENIAGQVSIEGSYGGTLIFQNLARGLRYESQNTELRVEVLPGRISMDLGELAARDVVGPVRLVTQSRDVRIEGFTNSLELETGRGDVELHPVRLPLARIDVRSRSGAIELILPEKASFQLQASTDRGEAINEFGPPIEKETDGRSATLKGAVGQGPLLHLTTERGTVAVRKAGVTRL